MNYAPHIFGVHDYHPDWYNLVKQAGKFAWCVHTEAVGHNPYDVGTQFYPEGLTNIVRLNNGYGQGTGTIPTPDHYDDFAKRCANFVKHSQNIDFVVIGNEIALPWEWPTQSPILLVDYIRCYLKCYFAIKEVAPNVRIAPQAVAPWNDKTPDAQDWVLQLKFQLEMCMGYVDWVSLHAYSDGYGLNSFTNNPRMHSPYQHRYYGWETLYEFMGAIPAKLRSLPVIITEVNGNQTWGNYHPTWIQGMYQTIDLWNKAKGTQKILAACLFRWAAHDEKWDISRYPAVVQDFKQVLQQDYRHEWRNNVHYVNARWGLNLRKEPDGEVIRVLSDKTPVTVLAVKGDWLRVNVGNEEGYVFAKYVKGR